jgi:hypothetical protein
MRAMACFTFLLAALAMVSACADQPRSNTLKVCYVPFNVETFNAITPSSIFEQTCQDIQVASPVAVDLQKYLSDKSNPADDQPDFDFRVVRVGVLQAGKPPIFVDRSGVVVNSYHEYQLPASTLKSLRNILDKSFGDSVK